MGSKCRPRLQSFWSAVKSKFWTVAITIATTLPALRLFENDILANIFKKLNSISSGSQTASNGLNLRFGSQSEQGASDAEAECILRSFFLHIFCMGWQESSNWICEEDEFDKVDKKFVQAEIADWIDKEIKVNKFRAEVIPFQLLVITP